MFYWLSKMFWLIFAPESLLVLLIISSWLSLRLGFKTTTHWLLGLTTTLVVLITLLPIGEWLLYPLETRFKSNPELPETIDGVIMLGGAGDFEKSLHWGLPEVSEAADRYLAFLELARRYPHAQLLFAGGNGSMLGQSYPEAELAKSLFERQGISSNRLLIEPNSRNTYENAVNSLQLIKLKPGEHWVLITTAWHMPRTIGIFCRLNWPVTPYPVDHYTKPDQLWRIDAGFSKHLGMLNIGVKEWLGLFVYNITGKTSELIPRVCVW